MTAISQEDALRYKAALDKLAVLGGGNSHGNDIAKEALSPKEEREEVEVVRWQCQACGMYGDPIDKNDKICGNCGNCGKPEVVKLTGTYSRPKKRKVLRREEINAEQIKWGARCDADEDGTVKYYREWYTEE